jgi:hypothetical protein
LIFKTAPPWLLWFTYGDVNARILGIKLPDLSTVNRFIRKRIDRIREKYKNVSKPLSDQEVITKIAVLHLLTRISGINRFALLTRLWRDGRAVQLASCQSAPTVLPGGEVPCRALLPHPWAPPFSSMNSNDVRCRPSGGQSYISRIPTSFSSLFSIS